jgi:ABC-type transport system involved in cytochrome c biogenesis permease subunit
MVALLIFAAVAAGMGAQAWVSWLEHQRRNKALDVIKAAIEAGREAPPQVYEQLETAARGEAAKPWSEVVVFAALAVGFWLAFALAPESDNRTAFFVIAVAMSVTSVGALAIALFRSRPPSGRDDRR